MKKKNGRLYQNQDEEKNMPKKNQRGEVYFGVKYCIDSGLQLGVGGCKKCSTNARTILGELKTNVYSAIVSKQF